MKRILQLILSIILIISLIIPIYANGDIDMTIDDTNISSDDVNTTADDNITIDDVNVTLDNTNKVDAPNVFFTSARSNSGVSYDIHWISSNESVAEISDDSRSVTFDYATLPSSSQVTKVNGEIVLALDGQRNYAPGEISLVLTLNRDDAYNRYPHTSNARPNSYNNIKFETALLNELGFKAVANSTTQTITLTNTKAINNTAVTYNLGFSFFSTIDQIRHYKQGIPVEFILSGNVGDVEVSDEGLDLYTNLHVQPFTCVKDGYRIYYPEEESLLNYDDKLGNSDDYFYVDYIVYDRGAAFSDAYFATITDNASHGGILVDVFDALDKPIEWDSENNTITVPYLTSPKFYVNNYNIYANDPKLTKSSKMNGGISTTVLRIAYPKTIEDNTTITNTANISIKGYQSNEVVEASNDYSFVFVKPKAKAYGDLFSLRKTSAQPFGSSTSLFPLMVGDIQTKDIGWETYGSLDIETIDNCSFSIIDDSVSFTYTKYLDNHAEMLDSDDYYISPSTFKLTTYTKNPYKKIIDSTEGEDYLIEIYGKTTESRDWENYDQITDKSKVIEIKYHVTILNPDILFVDYRAKAITTLNTDTKVLQLMNQQLQNSNRESSNLYNTSGLQVYSDNNLIFPSGIWSTERDNAWFAQYNTVPEVVDELDEYRGYGNYDVGKIVYRTSSFTNLFANKFTTGTGKVWRQSTNNSIDNEKYKTNTYGDFILYISDRRHAALLSAIPKTLINEISQMSEQGTDVDAFISSEQVQTLLNEYVICIPNNKVIDFLPPEFTIDSVTEGKYTPAQPDIDIPYIIEQNYDNSGRAALIIDLSSICSKEAVEKTLRANFGRTINVDVLKTRTDFIVHGGIHRYDIENANDYGMSNYVTTFTDSSIAESQGELSTGNPNISQDILDFTEESFKEYLISSGYLTTNGKLNHCGAAGTGHLSILTSESSFIKRVSVDDKKTVEMSNIVELSGNYSYMLLYSTANNQMSKDIVIFDSLEDAYEDDPYWKGTFKSVDTSWLDRLGIEYTIYYSTQNLDFTNTQNTDLSDTTIWSTDIQDKSLVKSVAIQLNNDKYGQPFVLGQNQSIKVWIDMTAPEGKEQLPNSRAYNKAFIQVSSSINGLMYSPIESIGVQRTDLRLNLGSLKIKKHIEDATEASENTDFRFKITLSRDEEELTQEFDTIKTTVNSASQESTFTSGDIISLKAEEEFEILNIPANTDYDVEELSTDGWTITDSTNASGSIVENETVLCEYTNKYSTAGIIELMATKSLIGRTLEEGEFIFELYDEDNNLISTATNLENGRIYFPIITYDNTDLNKTHIYTIKEVIKNDTNTVYDNSTKTVSISLTDDGKGHISTTVTGSADFVNTDTNSIKLTKVVTGSTTDKEFEFIVSVWTKNDSDIVYFDFTDQGGISNNDGSYLFKLKHNDTLTLFGIPYGYKYKVEEKAYHEYTQSIDGDRGRLVESTLYSDVEHSFENKLRMAIPTKVRTNYFTSFVVILLALIILRLVRFTKQKIFN